VLFFLTKNNEIVKKGQNVLLIFIGSAAGYINMFIRPPAVVLLSVLTYYGLRGSFIVLVGKINISSSWKKTLNEAEISCYDINRCFQHIIPYENYLQYRNSFDHCVVCFLLTIVLSVFFWPLCCLFSFDHCVVCFPAIYGFWYPFGIFKVLTVQEVYLNGQKKTDNTMVKRKQINNDWQNTTQKI
jgi:hypothetical protein